MTAHDARKLFSLTEKAPPTGLIGCEVALPTSPTCVPAPLQVYPDRVVAYPLYPCVRIDFDGHLSQPDTLGLPFSFFRPCPCARLCTILEIC